MATVGLIFPHQLFRDWRDINCDYYALIEDSLFFGDHKYPISFHKHKLILHRASMQAFRNLVLREKQTGYYQYVDFPNLKTVAQDLEKRGFKKFIVFDLVDYVLELRLRNLFGGRLTVVKSPNFVTDVKEFAEFFEKTGRKFMHQFYIWQRKRLGILVSNGKPYGGKWSFDSENRKKLPPNIQLPPEPLGKSNPFVEEAKIYVGRHFPDNPGDCSSFSFPVTHEDAEDWLTEFLEKRLMNFGPFQDAITSRGVFLFHSGLSCLINTGLLSPTQVVNRVLEKVDEAQISSIEGFVRQIIGWREFMRAVYVLDGTKIRRSNLFNHQLKLGETPIFNIPPVDNCVRKAKQNCYLHHIERLMILGNFFLLLELHPDEVYRWFMANTIDAYDWVMVPNVYAMSQFACGDLITTKPYFSGSNYILKMSDYKKDRWCDVWDGLFYRFVSKNYGILSKNPRIGPIYKRLLNVQGINDKVMRGDAYVQTLLESQVLRRA